MTKFYFFKIKARGTKKLDLRKNYCKFAHHVGKFTGK